MTILSSVPGSAFAARSVDINSIHTSRASRKIRLFDGLRAGRGGCLVRAAERAGAQVQELSSLPASHNKAGFPANGPVLLRSFHAFVWRHLRLSLHPASANRPIRPGERYPS